MAVFGELVPVEEERPRQPQIVQASPTPQPIIVQAQSKEDDKLLGIVLAIIGMLLMLLGFYKLMK